MQTWPKHYQCAIWVVWVPSGGTQLRLTRQPQLPNVPEQTHTCKDYANVKNIPTYSNSSLFSLSNLFIIAPKGEGGKVLLRLKIPHKNSPYQEQNVSRLRAGRREISEELRNEGEGGIGLYRVMQLGCLFVLAGPLKEAAETNWLHPTGCFSVPALQNSLNISTKNAAQPPWHWQGPSATEYKLYGVWILMTLNIKQKSCWSLSYCLNVLRPLVPSVHCWKALLLPYGK